MLLVVDLLHLLLYRLDHGAAVCPAQHHHDAANYFFFSVHERGALPDGLADLHVGNVADENRRARARGQTRRS